MSDHLLNLADTDLRQMAAALRSGRLSPPYSTLAVGRYVPANAADGVAADLRSLADLGFTPEQAATTLELLSKERDRRTRGRDAIDLVTTGPEVRGVTNRDTRVVVRELFAQAKETVLIAGYAVYQGRQVFQSLADRMEQLPTLRVRMFLDIQRGPGDTSTAAELVRRFADRFRENQWPKDRRLPEVYFDPRSLELSTANRACLHAKCVVVDSDTVFVSSANFTEAAHERNIEMGLLIRSPSLAERIEWHFNALVAEGLLQTAF